MRTAIAVPVAALVLACIAIWMNIDWRARYTDCDKKKEECYKEARQAWAAARVETDREAARIDSLERVANEDTVYVPTLQFEWMRRRLSDNRIDNLIAYLKLKEHCEEEWEKCVGEE